MNYYSERVEYWTPVRLLTISPPCLLHWCVEYVRIIQIGEKFCVPVGLMTAYWSREY